MRAFALVAFAAIVAACHSTSSADGVPTTAKPAHAPKIHRVAANACPPRPPSGTGSNQDFVHDDPAKPPTPKECAVDADCTKGKNGRCLHQQQYFRGAPTTTSYTCSYESCSTDADCGNGAACLCRAELGNGGVNLCVVAGCKTDADCGGSTCSPTYALSPGGQCRSEGGGYQALRCHGPDDECTDDSDCAPSGKDCAYSEAKKHWVCDSSVCLPD